MHNLLNSKQLRRTFDIKCKTLFRFTFSLFSFTLSLTHCFFLLEDLEMCCLKAAPKFSSCIASNQTPKWSFDYRNYDGLFNAIPLKMIPSFLSKFTVCFWNLGCSARVVFRNKIALYMALCSHLFKTEIKKMENLNKAKKEKRYDRTIEMKTVSLLRSKSKQ